MLAYQEVIAPPRLRPFVECFWFLHGRAGGEAERILPDGCMEIVVDLGDGVRRHDESGDVSRQPRCLVVGQLDRYVTIEPHGAVDLVGIRFQPAGAFPFFDRPLDRLRGTFVDLDDVTTAGWGERLCDRLARSAATADRVTVLADELASRLPACPPKTRAAAAVARLVATGGLVTVDSLARDAGISTRQVERLFRNQVGVGPKLLGRILRFQGVFRAVEHGPASSWAAVALRQGFCDQAHLINEFHRFAGRTPPMLLAADRPLTRFFLRARRSEIYKT